MRRRLILIFLLSVGLLLVPAGCEEEQAESTVVGDELVTFTAHLAVNDDEEVVVDLGLHSGSGPLAADETFNGRWELKSAEGEPRAAADVHEIDRVPGGTEEVIFSWRGKLTPGEYEMTWGAPAYGSTLVEFEVVETADGELRLGDHQDIYNTTAYPPAK